MTNNKFLVKNYITHNSAKNLPSENSKSVMCEKKKTVDNKKENSKSHQKTSIAPTYSQCSTVNEKSLSP